MAGAFLVSDFGLLVMMLRAFSRDLPCCGDRTHCKKQKTRYLCNFLRLGALLGSFRLEICHFCCVFVPRFAIGELATIANRKKVAVRADFLFLDSWNSFGTVIWSGRSYAASQSALQRGPNVAS